jgi:cobalt-zinc-cadmium efflux system membrane fusion protein
VSGVIASANAVAGQVVDARELVFEIIDPARLRIEALAFDPLAGPCGRCHAGRRRAACAAGFLGAARSLREQALPLGFRRLRVRPWLSLAVGQPVRVFVQTKHKVKGVRCPVPR